MFRIYSGHTVGKGSSVNSEEEVDTDELMSRENGPHVKEMEVVFLDIELLGYRTQEIGEA